MLSCIAFLPLLSVALTLSVPSSVHVGAKGFNYDLDDTDVGPGYWHHVSKDCGKSSQSPIDIVSHKEVTPRNSHRNRPRITLAKKSTLSISESAHNFALSCKKKGKCGKTRFQGKTYRFVGLHFHSQSEHTIDGKHFPLEMHMVHQAKNGALAVVATMFEYSETGEDNKILEKILDRVEAGKKFVNLRLRALVRHHKGYHVYKGSLTTPPCTEGVTWIIAEEHLMVSRSQVERFLQDSHSVDFGNNRPVQSINGRVVNKYGSF